MQRLIVEDENGMLNFELVPLMKGGRGSGNFGHSGRPGNIGGSSAGGGGVWSGGGAGGDSTIFGSTGEHPATPMMQSKVGTRTFSGVEVTTTAPVTSNGLLYQDVSASRGSVQNGARIVTPSSKADSEYGTWTSVHADGSQEVYSSYGEAYQDALAEAVRVMDSDE